MDILQAYTVSADTLCYFLTIDPQRGLTNSQVRDNRTQFGTNILESLQPASLIQLIFEGIREPMMLVLLSFAALSFIFGKYIESITMIFVVAAYVSIECINKYRADRTLLRLKKLTQPTARILRNGTVQEISQYDIVVGDCVILTPGSFIPADMRLINTSGLMLQEAALTGESAPVLKNAQAILNKNIPIPERINCVFSGTFVVDGEGIGIVFAVGKTANLAT